MKKLFAAFLVLATVACAAGCNASVAPDRRTVIPETIIPHRDTGVHSTETIPNNNNNDVIIP